MKQKLLVNSFNDSYDRLHQQKNISMQDNFNESIFSKDVQKILLNAFLEYCKN